jgi:HAD superfamily hydrolase (TIGR01450 family)
MQRLIRFDPTARSLARSRVFLTVPKRPLSMRLKSGHVTPAILETSPQRLSQIRHVALDMDGTIYSGGTLFPFTIPFLGLLKELGIGHTFLTNNSSKSTRDYLVHLRKMGITATAAEVYTSTQATVEYLREKLPRVRRLFLLGTPSLGQEIMEAGFTLTAEDPGDEPEAVLVGFDTTLSFSRLCRAAWWIKRGKPFIATHPDRTCPTDQPTVLVDCGSICAALERATARAPDAVLGKPDPCMIRGILQRHSLAPAELAMAGDRLYTDMAMARRAGALGVLVLTGETTAADVAQANQPLDFVVASLEEFGERLREAYGERRKAKRDAAFKGKR